MRRLTGLLALVFLLAPTAFASGEHEPVLDAADLVAPGLLAGPGWQVESRVPVRGGLARFTLHTRWGTLQADGVEELAARISEVPALEAVYEARVSRVLAEAARDRASEPLDAAAAIAGSPHQALVGLPAGIGRYFSERWQRLRAAVRRTADLGNQHLRHSGSPYGEPGGALGAAGDEKPARVRGAWRSLGREAERLAKQEVGYASARRALARRLGVDPGTRNPLLSPRLDALAWAETSGRFASGYVLGLVTGPAAEVMSRSVEVDQWVLQQRPVQVRRVNAALLELHCVDDTLSRAFLRDGSYGARLQTDLVRLLDAIDPDDGCELLLETALMADDESQARFVVQGLRLLDAALAPEQRRGRFIAQGAWLAYLDPQGGLWLPLGLDWLGWTPEMAAWFDQPLFVNAGPQRVLAPGQVSDRARTALAARGWSVLQPAAYPGRPPYREPSPG